MYYSKVRIKKIGIGNCSEPLQEIRMDLKIMQKAQKSINKKSLELIDEKIKKSLEPIEKLDLGNVDEIIENAIKELAPNKPNLDVIGMWIEINSTLIADENNNNNVFYKKADETNNDNAIQFPSTHKFSISDNMFDLISRNPNSLYEMVVNNDGNILSLTLVN